MLPLDLTNLRDLGSVAVDVKLKYIGQLTSKRQEDVTEMEH